MPTESNLKNKVAIVTGAGGGLGRSHAYSLAKLGAYVVVNDPGVSVSGSGNNPIAADETVALIKKEGGAALANYSGVESMKGAQEIVDAAVNAFGRIDIVINNAGILLDGSFKKQEDEAWQKVLDVHLTGSRNVTKAAWPHLCAQNYGRVIMTTSGSGLYGNFGQTNYAAAKMGLWGLMQALKEEGAKHNVFVNAIAPVAKSRMTENIMPGEILEKMKPEFISPFVCFLASEYCHFSGQCFSVAAGHISRVLVMETKGVKFLDSTEMSLENIKNKMGDINRQEGLEPFNNLMESTLKLIG